MLKFNKKTLIIHGCILAAMLIVCCIEFHMFILWYLGYIIYFTARLIAKGTRNLHPRGLKIFMIACMTAGSVFSITLACIPAWFISVCYSIKHPAIEEDVSAYTVRNGVLLQNVSSYRDYNNCFFEGDIAEDALKKAALLNNWNFQEIIRPKILSDTAKTRIKSHREKTESSPVTVERGLIFSSHTGNGGGTCVVYDRKTKRLYFSASSR